MNREIEIMWNNDQDENNNNNNNNIINNSEIIKMRKYKREDR